jgi:LPXTG-motif cell wall-anchored protein
LTTPGSGTPGTPAASTAATGGIPVWPFVAGGAAVIVIAAGWALRRAKRR